MPNYTAQARAREEAWHLEHAVEVEAALRAVHDPSLSEAERTAARKAAADLLAAGRKFALGES